VGDESADSDMDGLIAAITLDETLPDSSPYTDALFRPLTAVDDDYSMDYGTGVSGNVLDNDPPAGDDVLTVTLDAGPGHGTLTLNTNGSFAYSPDVGFWGIDTFTYRVTDAYGLTATAVVTLRVGERENFLPVVYDELYDGPAGVPVSGNVLANDYDPDGDPLTVTLVRGPAHGTLTLNADGSFTYTPDSGDDTYDSFEYLVSDGWGGTGSAVGTFQLTNPGGGGA
jgi:VCBS repeat-containing protein